MDHQSATQHAELLTAVNALLTDRKADQRPTQTVAALNAIGQQLETLRQDMLAVQKTAADAYIQSQLPIYNRVWRGLKRAFRR